MRRGWVVAFALAQVVWSVRIMKHTTDFEEEQEVQRANWDSILKEARDLLPEDGKKEAMIQEHSDQKWDDPKDFVHFPTTVDHHPSAESLTDKAENLTDKPLDVMYASLVGSVPQPVQQTPHQVMQQRIDAIYTAMSFFAMGLVLFAWLYLRSAANDDNDPKAKLRAAVQQQAKEYFAEQEKLKSAPSSMCESTDGESDKLFSDDESEATPISPPGSPTSSVRGSVLDRAHIFESYEYRYAKPDRSVKVSRGHVLAKAAGFESKK